MGYEGKTVNGLSSLGPKMGKAHGGGVKLERKSPGKISDMQDSVLRGEQTKKEDNAMAKSGVISGSHSKGGFMKHAKSSKGYAKANYDKDMAEERIQIKDDKNKIYEDDKEKRDSSPKKMLSKKQSKVIDGADGSKKNGKIEGSEMAALSKK